MKPKISPEEYREILESITLDTLYLTNLRSKLEEDYLSKALDLDISEKFSFEQDKNSLNILYRYKLTAQDKKMEKPALTIQADYSVKYDIHGEVTISKEFIKIFTDLTLSMLLWTYFRELVNNMVYRMGMPPLVLPMKRR